MKKEKISQYSKIQSSFVAQHDSTRFRIHIFLFLSLLPVSVTKIIVLKFPLFFYANKIFFESRRSKQTKDQPF